MDDGLKEIHSLLPCFRFTGGAPFLNLFIKWLVIMFPGFFYHLYLTFVCDRKILIRCSGSSAIGDYVHCFGYYEEWQIIHLRGFFSGRSRFAMALGWLPLAPEKTLRGEARDWFLLRLETKTKKEVEGDERGDQSGRCLLVLPFRAPCCLIW